MITTFLARITPPCKDITSLVSQSMDRRLPWSRRIQLQLHLLICQACTQYRDQLRILRQVLRRSTAAENDQSNKSSSSIPTAKARLTEAFRAKHE